MLYAFYLESNRERNCEAQRRERVGYSTATKKENKNKKRQRIIQDNQDSSYQPRQILVATAQIKT